MSSVVAVDRARASRLATVYTPEIEMWETHAYIRLAHGRLERSTAVKSAIAGPWIVQSRLGSCHDDFKTFSLKLTGGLCDSAAWRLVVGHRFSNRQGGSFPYRPMKSSVSPSTFNLQHNKTRPQQVILSGSQRRQDDS